MDYTLIKNEITNDPRSMGYASMTHDQIVSSLNTKNITVQEPISSRNLLLWGGNNSRLDSITSASTNTSLTGAVRSVAIAALHMISRADTELDMTDSNITQMFNVLVGASILTSSDLTSLNTLSQVSRSWAEENWGRDITVSDLNIAGV